MTFKLEWDASRKEWFAWRKRWHGYHELIGGSRSEEGARRLIDEYKKNPSRFIEVP